MHDRLFIPGRWKFVLGAASDFKPQVGHRTQAYMDVHSSTIPLLKKILYTGRDVTAVHLFGDRGDGRFVAQSVMKKALVTRSTARFQALVPNCRLQRHSRRQAGSADGAGE
ncbi:MAG: hypothetical protein IPH10_04530 [bacterium]|nr:hypothetical protein [bacterium]